MVHTGAVNSSRDRDVAKSPESRRLWSLLHDNREDIGRLVARHRAHNPRVFGSVRHGTARPGSDVDLVVDFKPGASILDQAALTRDLRELLGVEVDVHSARGIRTSRSPATRRILDDLLPL